MAKKYVPLLIRLDESDLDGMEEAIQVLGDVFLSHGGESITDGLSDKVRKDN